MKTIFVGTATPTAEQAAKGAEIVFIRRNNSTGQTVEIMGATCHESWEQWGQPSEILSENVEDIEKWRKTVQTTEEA